MLTIYSIIFEIYPLILEARGSGEKMELSVKEINGDEIMEVKNALVTNDEQIAHKCRLIRNHAECIVHVNEPLSKRRK